MIPQDAPGRSDRGQATVEVAVLISLFALIATFVVDVGYYSMCEMEVRSAATGAARFVEAQPVADVRDVQAWLEHNHPQIAESCSCEMEDLGRDIEGVDYKIYSLAESGFQTRPSHVAVERYKIKVSFAGKWLSPVFAAAVSATGGDLHYTLEAEAVASVDATVEEW